MNREQALFFGVMVGCLFVMALAVYLKTKLRRQQTLSTPGVANTQTTTPRTGFNITDWIPDWLKSLDLKMFQGPFGTICQFILTVLMLTLVWPAEMWFTITSTFFVLVIIAHLMAWLGWQNAGTTYRKVLAVLGFILLIVGLCVRQDWTHPKTRAVMQTAIQQIGTQWQSVRGQSQTQARQPEWKQVTLHAGEFETFNIPTGFRFTYKTARDVCLARITILGGNSQELGPEEQCDPGQRSKCWQKVAGSKQPFRPFSMQEKKEAVQLRIATTDCEDAVLYYAYLPK